MKKKLLVLMPILAIALTSCGKSYKVEDYVLTLNKVAGETFDILQLTDLHIGEKDDFEKHAKFMDLTINEANPDIIIVTGDLFTFASKSTAKRLFKYFDDKKIPWTVTFGNHDEQAYFSVEWMTRQLNENYEYCYFKDLQDDDVHGNANFAINVMEGNLLFEQLIIMDSNRYDFKTMDYDCFKQDQIDWYRNLVTETQKTYPGYESMMFYHIPLPEINAAYDYGMEHKETNYLFGSKGEKPCPPAGDPGFFKVIDELDSTTAMFFGHDHDNDFGVSYNGVDFIYGVKSTNTVYYTESKLGGLKITIDPLHVVHYKQIFHTYEEVK